MRPFREIAEKLREIISEEDGGRWVSDKEVAGELGLSPSNYGTMKTRDKVPFKEIADFCARRKISLNWLFYGQDPESLVEPTNRYFYVRYFREVSASAGGGAVNWDEGFEELGIEERFADHLGISGSSVDAVNVAGDSMEPTLKDGDVVFLDRKSTAPGKGGIFAVATAHGIFVKRLQVRVDGNVDIISDNRDYPVQTIPGEEVTVIGKVVGMLGAVG